MKSSLRFMVRCLCIAGLLLPGAGSGEIFPQNASHRQSHSIEEVKLGRQFMRNAHQQLTFVSDPEITAYIKDLGSLLLEKGDLDPRQFRFLVVQNDSLNAFAVPGGFIGIHTGLVSRTETESELASVIAHEIAHITQRHLPRMIERAETRTLPAVAAMVAAILIGGQAGATAVLGANAAMIADQLRYNREFEKEADAVGLQFLGRAGFNTMAMPGFFLKLQKSSELHAVDVPEYLQTHPLSVGRIADSEARAAELSHRAERNAEDYLHVRARITALTGNDPTRLADLFAQSADFDSVAGRAAVYGEVLAAMRSGQYERARHRGADLLARVPDSLRYQLLGGQIDYDAGNYGSAADAFGRIYAGDKKNVTVGKFYASALIADGALEDARRVLRRWQRMSPENPEIPAMMSRVYGEMGRMAEAFQSRAEYFALRFRLPQALSELDKALEHASDNYYLRESLIARKAALTAEMQRFDERAQ